MTWVRDCQANHFFLDTTAWVFCLATGGDGGDICGSLEAGAVVVPRSIAQSSNASGLSAHGTRSRRAATAASPASSSRVVLVVGPSDDAAAKVTSTHTSWPGFFFFFFQTSHQSARLVSSTLNCLTHVCTRVSCLLLKITGWRKFGFIHVPSQLGRGTITQRFSQWSRAHSIAFVSFPRGKCGRKCCTGRQGRGRWCRLKRRNNAAGRHTCSVIVARVDRLEYAHGGEFRRRFGTSAASIVSV
jgi:hypothetical protein